MENREFSRQKFFANSGKLAIGTAIGLGSISINSCNRKDVTKEIPEPPWPYTRLDPEVVRKKGHFFTYEGG